MWIIGGNISTFSALTFKNEERGCNEYVSDTQLRRGRGVVECGQYQEMDMAVFCDLSIYFQSQNTLVHDAYRIRYKYTQVTNT